MRRAGFRGCGRPAGLHVSRRRRRRGRRVDGCPLLPECGPQGRRVFTVVHRKPVQLGRRSREVLHERAQMVQARRRIRRSHLPEEHRLLLREGTGCSPVLRRGHRMVQESQRQRRRMVRQPDRPPVREGAGRREVLRDGCQMVRARRRDGIRVGPVEDGIRL